jgi:protein AFG1
MNKVFVLNSTRSGRRMNNVRGLQLRPVVNLNLNIPVQQPCRVHSHSKPQACRQYRPFSETARRRKSHNTNSTSNSSSNYLVRHFESLVEKGEATHDEFQLKALRQLDTLRDHIIKNGQSHKFKSNQNAIVSIGDSEEMEAEVQVAPSFMNHLSSFFSSKSSNHDNTNSNSKIKGVYLHGGVGCGKTFCMNLFYDSLILPKCITTNNTNDNTNAISKQKVHFHSFMLNVHKQMHQAKMVHKIEGDVLPHIVQNTIQNGHIICFDEFQVTDVADALILRRLFTGLLESGAIIVATSNRPPHDLYLNGLQRDLFLPFIDLLNDTLDVVSMWDSDVDYRLIQGENKARGVYFTGMDNQKDEFEQAFQQLTKNSGGSSSNIQSTTLTTQGRNITVPQASLQHSIARFTFDDLCRQARGAADYLLIGENFHTVFVEDVPMLTMNDINLVRRFIIFVDSMYECNVKLIIHAATGPNDIFKIDLENQFCDEAFAFDRTRSRLEEMGSDEYLKKRWIAARKDHKSRHE